MAPSATALRSPAARPLKPSLRVARRSARILSLLAARRTLEHPRLIELDASDDKIDEQFTGIGPMVDPGIERFGASFE